MECICTEETEPDSQEGICSSDLLGDEERECSFSVVFLRLWLLADYNMKYVYSNNRIVLFEL